MMRKQKLNFSLEAFALVHALQIFLRYQCIDFYKSVTLSGAFVRYGVRENSENEIKRVSRIKSYMMKRGI